MCCIISSDFYFDLKSLSDVRFYSFHEFHTTRPPNKISWLRFSCHWLAANWTTAFWIMLASSWQWLVNDSFHDVGPTPLAQHCSTFHFDIGPTSDSNQLPTVDVTLGQCWANYALLDGMYVSFQGYGEDQLLTSILSSWLWCKRVALLLLKWQTILVVQLVIYKKNCPMPVFKCVTDMPIFQTNS